MDEEARLLSEEAYGRTVALMEKYKEDVAKVAELLLQQETISHTDVAKLIGDRKFSAGAEYDEFVSMKKKLEDVITSEPEKANVQGDADKTGEDGEPKKPDEPIPVAPAV